MHLVILLSIFLVVSCGKAANPEGDQLVQKSSMESQGYYRAPFVLINKSLSKGVSGRGSFFINPIQFYAKVNLTTPWRDITHIQMLHAGNRCPDRKDDINADGYVDGMETMSASGKGILPLDYNIRSRTGKFTVYPVSDPEGKYVYSQATSTTTLMYDLRTAARTGPLDFMGRLEKNEELTLDQRVVIVYGVPETEYLPSTVKGFEGFPPHMSLPIACGKFVETDEVFP
ncbi:MAG TPA: hypothetical protein VNJ08_14885 [Bacteriovoracaceae bacterium]|nr:hypothetical protein [Bacteriovoracaceae bacterium]